MGLVSTYMRSEKYETYHTDKLLHCIFVTDHPLE